MTTSSTDIPLPYTYARKGRSWSTLIALLFAWSVCIIGITVLSVQTWIAALVLLLTLPALWDLYSGAQAGVYLDSERVKWWSGRHSAEIVLDEVLHFRLVTRLDLSIRAAVILRNGQKLRLPAEATPPADAFEAALRAADVKHERHHFTFL